MSCTPESLPEAFLTTSYTETEDGVACMTTAYVAHIVLAYVCVLAGIIALLSRVIKPIKRFHTAAGLTFILTMYFVEGSATLIFNTGLPRAIIIFLSLMLVSMVSGIIAIKAHKQRFRNAVLEKADELQRSKEKDSLTVSELTSLAEKQLLERPRSWKERLFSLKALHGYLMTFAWYQMAGRAGVTNPFDWEKCFAYPVYKNVGSNGELVLIPGITSEDITQQYLFATYIEVPAIIVLAIIAILLCILFAYLSKRNGEKSVLIEEEN